MRFLLSLVFTSVAIVVATAEVDTSLSQQMPLGSSRQDESGGKVEPNIGRHMQEIELNDAAHHKDSKTGDFDDNTMGYCKLKAEEIYDDLGVNDLMETPLAFLDLFFVPYVDEYGYYTGEEYPVKNIAGFLKIARSFIGNKDDNALFSDRDILATMTQKVVPPPVPPFSGSPECLDAVEAAVLKTAEEWFKLMGFPVDLMASPSLDTFAQLFLDLFSSTTKSIFDKFVETILLRSDILTVKYVMDVDFSQTAVSSWLEAASTGKSFPAKYAAFAVTEGLPLLDAFFATGLDTTLTTLYDGVVLTCTVPAPSDVPSFLPSSQPSKNPSALPSSQPSESPSALPSSQPSESASPSSEPSRAPSTAPSETPSNSPSFEPSQVPSVQPSTSAIPSSQPSSQPSALPSVSASPSQQPSMTPSQGPSESPSLSAQPSGQPSKQPSLSASPSQGPSVSPSQGPSSSSESPSLSNRPSSQPSNQPSGQPSETPSSEPSAAVDGFEFLNTFTNVDAAVQTRIETVLLDLERVVTATLPSYTMPGDLSFDDCGTVTSGTVVDDINVCTKFGDSTDFPPGTSTLGFAGPRFFFDFGGGIDQGRPAAVGTCALNPTLLTTAAGFFDDVVKHEYLHVMGIGTLWDQFGLVSADGVACTGYSPTAMASVQYQMISDCGSTIGVPLQIDDDGFCGGHWSPDCFTTEELMTPTTDGSGAPLSAITIGSLADMTYAVDLGQAQELLKSNLDSSCICPTMSASLNGNVTSSYTPTMSAARAEAIAVGTNALLKEEQQITEYMASMGDTELESFKALKIGSVLSVMYLENGRLHDVLVHSKNVWTQV